MFAFNLCYPDNARRFRPYTIALFYVAGCAVLVGCYDGFMTSPKAGVVADDESETTIGEQLAQTTICRKLTFRNTSSHPIAVSDFAKSIRWSCHLQRTAKVEA